MRNNNLRKNSEYNKKSKILYDRIFLLIIILAFIFCLIKFVVPDKTVDVASSNLSADSRIAENSTNNINSDSEIK